MDAEAKINPQSKITLREINGKTVRAVCNLKVTAEQNRFVAPVADSIAQAYFEPKAWFRAIYADETPVGFVMLHDDQEMHLYYLWRFMIDTRYQKMGIGKQAIQLLVAEVRTRPKAAELLVSYVPDEDGPGPFYNKLGFKPTGEMEGIEEVARLDLL